LHLRKEFVNLLLMIVLYSTNTALKYRIQRDFLADVHYCWCSPAFDARKLAPYARGAAMPPSSDPCSIYRDLHAATQRPDGHCDKINSQRTVISALAVNLEHSGKIDANARDEIIEMVNRASSLDWKPYLYVIPNTGFGARLKEVPRARRASNEMEYIIEDLKATEFHILEFPE
jgi:hypothetical protein